MVVVVVELSILVDDDMNRTPTLTRGLTLWLVGLILGHVDVDDDSRYAHAERWDENLDDDGVLAFDDNREHATLKGRLCV